MILSLNEVKKWLRLELDYLEEDDILQLLLDNAEGYLYNSIDNFELILNENNTRFINKCKLIMMVLVTDWYENRDFTGKPSEKVRYTIQSIIAQLQYCYESSDTL